MALGALFLLEVGILIAFIFTTIFMFLPKKNDTVHKIFFAMSVFLAVFITVIDATALPSNYKTQIIIAWLFAVPAGLGIIVAAAKGKPGVFSKLMVILTSILGCVGYFFLM